VGGFPYRDEDFTWAPAHFPAVGLLIGGLSALAFRGAAPLGPSLAAACAVLTSVALTGAFHEDGLADTFDALGGSHGGKKLFEILRDSRLGTYGVTALAFSLLFRVLLLARLSELPGPQSHLPLLCLPLVHALARTGPVFLMLALPCASPDGNKSGSVARGGLPSRAVVALLWAALGLYGAALLDLPARALLLLPAAAAGTTLLSARWFQARAGGWTGDFLGATEQLTEVALLFTLTLVLSGSGTP